MAAPVQTVTIDRRAVVGDRHSIEATITYDTGNYVTGGVAIAASDFGLQELHGIHVFGSSVHVGEYDHVAGKMRLRVAATGAEVANAAALTTGSSLKVRAIGV